MASAPESETPARELKSFVGDIVDAVLAIASNGANPDAAEAIRWARVGLRSGRPSRKWVWPESVEQRLVDLSVETLPEELENLISDALGVADGTLEAYDIGGKWDTRRPPPLDMLLELEPFRTTVSFDEVQEQFRAHIDASEPLEVIVRGHLWIEASLNALINRKATSPDELSIARLTFAQKVAVALAFGALRPELAAPIRKINKLRNRFAHDLDTTITETDQREVIAACGPLLRIMSEIDKKDWPVPDGIVQIISALVVVLYGLGDEEDARARYDAFMRQDLIRALGYDPAQRGA